MDPEATYYAPGVSTRGGWELILPADLNDTLATELRKLGGRLTPATVRLSAYWTIPAKSVQAVSDLLYREGLRGEPERAELLVDEVLSYLTPRELQSGPGHLPLPGRIRWLVGLPDAEYAKRAEVAARRARPELEPLLAGLDKKALLAIIAHSPDLSAMLTDRDLRRANMAELSALIREYVDSAAELKQLIHGRVTTRRYYSEADRLADEYSRNERLYPLLLELKGQTVSIVADLEYATEAEPMRIDGQVRRLGEVVGSRVITTVRPPPERRPTHEFVDFLEVELTPPLAYQHNWDHIDFKVLTFLVDGGLRERPELYFSDGRFRVDLRPLLLRQYAQHVRHRLPALRAVLPPDLVKYVGQAI